MMLGRGEKGKRLQKKSKRHTISQVGCDYLSNAAYCATGDVVTYGGAVAPPHIANFFFFCIFLVLVLLSFLFNWTTSFSMELPGKRIFTCQKKK